MKVAKYRSALMLSLLLLGCSQSMVTSKRAKPNIPEKGVIYSLPKQLVKVTYNRKIIDSTEEELKKKKAQEAIESTKKAIEEKEKDEKSLERSLKDIDPQDANRNELENNLRSKLIQIKADKLVLANILTRQRDALSIAIFNHAKSLQSNEAFSEELTITAEEPIPDTNNTFYATIDHRIIFSDSLEISTKNGLLDGAIGHSEDKTGAVVVSLAGSLSGLLPSPLPVPPGHKFLPDMLDGDSGCKKRSVISIERTIDPSRKEDINTLNKQLHAGCIELCVASSLREVPKRLGYEDSEDGLIYRQPGIVTFKVKGSKAGNWNELSQCNKGNAEIQSINVVLAQGGQIGILPFPRGFASKNEYDVSFSNGMLSRSKIVQPSEALSTVSILPDALKAMISVPAELLQLKVNYSSREKEILELKKAMFEAQTEIIKKQAEIENLKKENNSE